MKRAILILTGLLGAILGVQAEEASGSKPPKVRFEWGAQVGAGYWSYATPAEVSDLRCALGWQAGITTALVWGKWALQPEIRYARHRLDFTPAPEAEAIEVKSNALEVPILVSWRPTPRWRIEAGPLLTVLNSCKHLTAEGLEFDLGRVRPTVGYTVGVGCTLGSRFLIGLRYVGGFSRVESILWENGPELKLNGHALQLNVGVVLR